jgi:CopG family transcriptional regulator, nickel-responsive regulator
MTQLERFGVSMEPELLAQFDALIESRGYASRSEAIRDLARRELVAEEWANPEAEVAGAIVLVYEHHEHALAGILTEVQHNHHECIVATTHVHMDAHNCLETIIVRGPSQRVREIANALISTRGVKHGQLVATTTGAGI